MFKVGDKVIVKGWLGDEAYHEGAVGVVTGINIYISVQFTHDPNTLLVRKEELEHYTEPTMTKEQAAGVAGGLQQHSVGDFYPLSVVTYANGDNTAHFVENLQDGTVAVLSSGSPYPYEFDSHDDAIRAIEAGVLAFSKGRPHYVKDAAVWVLYTETNPVRVVRLKNMLHHNTNSSGG